MKMRYHYRVDGGIVPTHHHPHSVEIVHDLDTDDVTYQYGASIKHIESVNVGVNKMLQDFDMITLVFVQAIQTTQLDEVIQWKKNRNIP